MLGSATGDSASVGMQVRGFANGRVVLQAATDAYGVELWTVDPNLRQTTHGDFNGDGRTDGMDFLTWQRQLGSTVSTLGGGADGNPDGVVNSGDLAAWLERFIFAASASATDAALAVVTKGNSDAGVAWLAMPHASSRGNLRHSAEEFSPQNSPIALARSLQVPLLETRADSALAKSDNRIIEKVDYQRDWVFAGDVDELGWRLPSILEDLEGP